MLAGNLIGYRFAFGEVADFRTQNSHYTTKVNGKNVQLATSPAIEQNVYYNLSFTSVESILVEIVADVLLQ